MFSDLIKFSKKYPHALFQLTGEGEESEDIWIFYVRDGKSFKSKAKIVFESFDEINMKTEENKIIPIRVLSDSESHTTREPDITDEWDNGETHTDWTMLSGWSRVL